MGITYDLAKINNYEEFKDLTDKEVVMLAKNGDNMAQEYVISKYEQFVKAKSKSYFLIGADKEDIYQEGMIGLYKAIRDFNPDKFVYISCNPATLVRDIKEFENRGYKMGKVKLMDMFPKTPHVEAIVKLEKL